MEKFMEKTIRSEQKFSGKIIDLHVDDVLLPNGETSQREIVKHPGAVAIIPMTSDRKIVFVEQYRKPLEKSIVEIPAGKLERGEQPEVTAIRELEEETGYTTDRLTFVTSFYTSPGFADELMYIYLADELTPLEQPILGDEDEFVEKITLTLDEAQKCMEEQRIHDAKTAYALLYLQRLGMK